MNLLNLFATKMSSKSAIKREEIAKQLFNIETMKEKINEASEHGYENICISPQMPVELHLTDAAKQAEDELTKMGFKISWESEYITPAKSQNITGLAQRQTSLIISWSTAIAIDKRKLPRIVDLSKTC